MKSALETDGGLTAGKAWAGREVGLLHEAIEDCSAALASVPAAAPLAVNALRMRLQVCYHRHIPCLKKVCICGEQHLHAILGHRLLLLSCSACHRSDPPNLVRKQAWWLQVCEGAGYFQLALADCHALLQVGPVAAAGLMRCYARHLANCAANGRHRFLIVPAAAKEGEGRGGVRAGSIEAHALCTSSPAALPTAQHGTSCMRRCAIL